MWNHILAHHVDALDVDVHRAVPVFLTQCIDPAADSDAGIVEQDVDPSEVFDHGLHGFFNTGFVGDVAADRQRVNALGPQFQLILTAR